MHVLIVGVNHRTAPVEVREKLAFASTQIADGVRDLLQGVGARECVILSTCNRA
ncbi:MAG: glutamyl-tRNA reductase, partial [Armatimonadetes bacterium CG_4_10_14_3_um_filter_66_18]